MVNLGDALFTKSLAFEPDSVETIGMSIASGSSFRKGQDIAGDGCSASDEGMGADVDKVMYRAKRADDGMIVDDYVPAERGRIRHDDVVSDLAIVRDVGVRHDEIMAAHTRKSTAFHRAPIDGDKFADSVVISYLETRGFAGVSQILRSQADRAEWKEAVVGADFGWAFSGYMRQQMASIPKLDMRSDHAIGADFATRSHPRAGIDNGSRVNFHGANASARVSVYPPSFASE